MKLLHVVSLTLSHAQDIGDALAHMRRLCARSEHLRCAILLFCDLPDAPMLKAPHEAPLIRSLLSRVTAMNARRADSFYLLVRRRVWDDAARQYLGCGQALSCREVIAQLLERGQTQASFEAASLAPASMKERWDAVLFSDIGMTCTPDVPARMVQYLQAHCLPAVGALALPRWEYPHSALARLHACSGVSLSPLHAAQTYAFSRQGNVSAEHPVLYTRQSLSHAASLKAVPAAPDCFFFCRRTPQMRDIVLAYRSLCRIRPLWIVCVPLAQLALLAAAALWGLSPLVAAALAPELWSLMHPRAWPGVLLRIAMLPLTALHALDALLCRLLSRSPLLRLRVPGRLFSPFFCLFAALALLPAALLSVHALASLLAILLLWLSAPLWYPALDQPTLERIPLDGMQRSHLRALAESAFFDAEKDACAPPSLRMLSSCAGCMLGLLEPDEAARQVQQMTEDLPDHAAAHEQAAVLVCAQYLREHMQSCDASLRPLPAQLESQFLTSSCAPSDSLLGRILAAARKEQTPDWADTVSSHLLDQLFLPLHPAKATQQHALSLPLTHPHTFLRRQLLSGETAVPQKYPVEHFLFLAAAALDHPFHALFLRSPVTGPYMELLCSGILFPTPSPLRGALHQKKAKAQDKRPVPK